MIELNLAPLITILSWEYPPRVVGQMAYEVDMIARRISQKLPVSVVTFHDAQYNMESISEKLEIHRVPNPVTPHATIVTWSVSLCSEIERIVADMYYDRAKKDMLIDVHGWHFIPAAVTLKKAIGIRFVFTPHSLEDHRTGNPSSALSSCIKGIEWLGLYESEFVSVNSKWMLEEINKIHSVPSTKIKVFSDTDQLILSYQGLLASQ
ncbi:MAG: glycosyltransferase [Conexivisphaerales archaeon]